MGGRSAGASKREVLAAFFTLIAPGGARAGRVSSDAGGPASFQDFGAACDGSRDDALALRAASTALRPVLHRSGVLRVATPSTLAVPLQLQPGAMILVDGVTLILAGGFAAVGVRCFTCLHGGRVMFKEGFVGEIDPRWWGFGPVDAASNDAARAAARDSIEVRGVVRFPPGVFSVQAYVPINRSYISFLGAGGQFGTTFAPVAGAGDVTGIDGTAQPGFRQGDSPYIDMCEHRDISVLRSDSQSAACVMTTDADSNALPAGVPTGARGLVHRYAANSHIGAVLTNNPIDYYEAQTTSERIDIRTVRHALPGDTARTLRFGLVSDCTIPALGNGLVRASNGSSYRRWAELVAFRGDGSTPIGAFFGGLVVGSDLRDHFWESVELGGGRHHLDYVCTGSGREAWDIHFTRLISDGWSRTGLRFRDLPAGSRVNIVDGYSAPFTATGPNPALGPSVDLHNVSGAHIAEGFEAKGGLNWPNHRGVVLRAGSARCKVHAACTGVRDAVVLDDASFNEVGPVLECFSEQPAHAAVVLVNGSTHNRIAGYVVAGEAECTYGVLIDATSPRNIIDGGIFQSGSGRVGHPIHVAGADVAAPGVTAGGVVITPSAVAAAQP